MEESGLEQFVGAFFFIFAAIAAGVSVAWWLKRGM